MDEFKADCYPKIDANVLVYSIAVVVVTVVLLPSELVLTLTLAFVLALPLPMTLALAIIKSSIFNQLSAKDSTIKRICRDFLQLFTVAIETQCKNGVTASMLMILQNKPRLPTIASSNC
uniref:Uncharacterized protein n=1 Tax=Glossina pallidipes TaxID=7398 RepID=A0A1A9Z671_GLOPL